uniref:GH74 n=1 Tax=uncultured Nocardioidaceae bacterium TaxID=253824 RepID=A0A6J4LWU6_9ACTN|nr:MAG: GH74 [uncultured Nocardioidaceae bacterium]
MNRRLRQSLVAATVGAVATTMAVVSVNSSGTPPVPVDVTGREGAPGALGAHLEQLRQTVPGDAGMPEEGPGAAAEAEFRKRAYPRETISVNMVEAAQQSFRQVLKTTSKAELQRLAPGRWRNVGPSRALYPFTPFRNASNYVPNKYVAGGRTTDVAIADTCERGDCRMYITPAGGGVWRTDDALAQPVDWTYLGGPLNINAAGTVTIDPSDPSGDTIWVGTGEANICGSGCVAGVGIYRSTNGGDTFRGPLGRPKLSGKGIGEIVADPRGNGTVYAATTTALRGMSSVCCDGVTRPVPGAAEWGLYKSTDFGRSWRMIHNGSARERRCTGSIDQFNNLEVCSPRGVRHFELDPRDPDTMYAGSYARGIWRSTDQGETWAQIKESLNPAVIQTRPAFDVVALNNGNTRMYVHEGNIGTPYSRLFRSDDVATGDPAFTDLTSANPADPGYATYNQCGGQCWYDLFVTSPDGHPNVVYTGGSYVYDETGGISNGRGVVLSTDAGVSGTDMTMDGTDDVHPNGLHPDQHALVTDPNNPFRFFEVNDGGIMRSTGRFSDVSHYCDDRELEGSSLTRCQQLLSRVPRRLIGMNEGLSTLQFIQLSVSPFDSDHLTGGTQDNGTWQTYGNRTTWRNIMIGDGGWSGFDAKVRKFRMHNFFDVSPEVNFCNGDIGKWIWTADPLYGQPGNQFYAPVITDPVVSGTMFAGTGIGVYRTKTFGLGNRSMAEAQRICNTWTGTFEAKCGDWKQTGLVPLTSDTLGDREGGAVAAVERYRGDRNTAWAATTTGRLFYSTNVAAPDPDRVAWQRLDIDSNVDPNRFISGVYPDATRPNVAYVSYSGYSSATPLTPGHVFRVRYNGSRAIWTDLSANLKDMPVTDIVRDDRTGDLYASTDFGVLRRAAGERIWREAAPGMPRVEVAGLTLVPGKRILYAASHGRSAFRLNL